MLDAHPQLTIPPETHFIPRALRAWHAGGAEGALEAILSHRRWPDFELDEADLRRDVSTQAIDEIGDVLRAFYRLYARSRDKPRWGDKSTNYIRHVRRIRRALPEARFVHLIRDGRDVAVSLRDVWFGPRSIAEAAEKWRDEVSKARRQARKMPGILEVRYEDLVSDPEPVLHEVCDFVQLEWDPEMLGYRPTAMERLSELRGDLHRGDRIISEAERVAHQANVSRPLSLQSVGRWRTEMSAGDRVIFDEQAGELLRELGYGAGDGG